MSNFARNLLLSMAVLAALQAQPGPQKRPEFEAAVIKLPNPENGVASWSDISATRFHALGTLQHLITIAYEVDDFQISGGPKWLNSDLFDVDAKPEHPADAGQRRLMLQSLLADRFHLVLHTTTKELPVYVLEPAAKGSKLQQARAGIGGMTAGNGMLTGAMSMPDLARRLASTLGRPVLDKTGLSGAFELNLHWTPDETAQAPATSPGPSLFTAIQEQLGLKLRATKGPAEVLVIDSAQKPSEN